MKRQNKSVRKNAKVRLRVVGKVTSLVIPYKQTGKSSRELIDIMKRTEALTGENVFIFEKVIDDCNLVGWGINITKAEKGTDFTVTLTFENEAEKKHFEKKVEKQLNGRMILC